MIPVKLQIKNFLSYGSQTQTIDFGTFPLICLSGKNGHGKSALLDALTWALWGQARKLSGMAKADQGLLRLGQTQMMVCLDFICGEQKYRIRREFMQTYGKPVAQLDFGLLDSDQDKFIPLTEKTIRDTQAKIEQMLHLSFDAFTNSAFLRQGQSNEFSKKSPKERKDVLASILGLSRYESIRKLASERTKGLLNQVAHIDAMQSKLEQQLANGQEICTKLLELNAQEQLLQAQSKELENNSKQFQQDHTNYLSGKQKQEMLLFALQQKELEQDKLTQKILSLRNEWRTVHAKLLRITPATHLETQKKKLLEEIQHHQQIVQKQLTLKQQLLSTKEQLQKIEHTITQAHQHEINEKKIALERLRSEKNHHLQAIEQSKQTETKIKNEHDQITLELHNQELQLKTGYTKAQSLESISKQFEKRKEHYHLWAAQANVLNAELKEIEHKNKLVDDEQAPCCPLCEQNLSAARRRFLKKKFEDDSHTSLYKFARLNRVLKILKPLLIEQHSQLEQIKKDVQEHQRTEQLLQETKRREDATRLTLRDVSATLIKFQELASIAQSTLVQEENILNQLIANQVKLVTNDATFVQYQKLHADLEMQLAMLPNEQQHYEKAIAQLSSIETQQEEYKKSQDEALLQNQRAHTIEQTCQILKQIKKEIAELKTARLDYDYLSNQEEILRAQKNKLDALHQELAELKNKLLHQKGSLEQEQKALEQVKKEHMLNQKERISSLEIINDYQAIAVATGKDGIQALLIEDAIPEIEQEANELLSRLTDNQTHLFIESLRDLKKGGTKETLDIKISDSVGIRPYELFSGGEAFRIDFALRIAISKLLARRAGTSLQTLIIDEGFGSQDEDGLALIMDSLYKIQDDFAKIIIVSHLSSMKNQFPIHFVIEKGPQGSIVEVVEQD